MRNNIIRTLLFGFELELLITSKPSLEVLPRWDDAVIELSKILSQNMIENEIYEQSSEAKPNYKKWTITEDGTIKQDRKAGQYGVELISNICTIETVPQRTSGWRSVQENLWNCLQNRFNVIPSESCGTHIHVSYRRKKGWSLRRLKWLACSVIYFERCIDSVMPEHRRHNKFCASNRYNRILRHKTMKEIFHLILQIRNTKQGHAELANLICPDGRWYRWNFQHMEKQNPHIQTIEFRQPPGSTASRGATFWPQFTISFVAGVVVDRRKHDPDIPATLAGLYNLVSSGASYVGMEDKDQLTQFFKDREQLQEEMYPEQTWTAEDGALVLARRGKEVVRERKKQAALEEQVALQELQGINLSDDETDENEL